MRAISAGSVVRSYSVSTSRRPGLGGGLDDPARRLEERGVRGEVEQDGRDVDAGHPVDERVVRLLDQPDVAAFEPLDEPQLPQRPGPVEELRLDPRGERQELLAAPRARAAR